MLFFFNLPKITLPNFTLFPSQVFTFMKYLGKILIETWFTTLILKPPKSLSPFTNN